jgi:hypothetical protein
MAAARERKQSWQQDASLAARVHHSVPLAARELLLLRTQSLFETLRMLLQHRLQDSDAGRAIVSHR